MSTLALDEKIAIISTLEDKILENVWTHKLGDLARASTLELNEDRARLSTLEL